MTARAAKRSGTSGRERDTRAAADLFEDVVRFEPITGPVLRWRLAGRRLRSSATHDGHAPSCGFRATPEAEGWQEGLRRHLDNHDGRPPGIEKRLVCRKGHALLWLVRSPWGVTPIARTATGARSRTSARDDGAPMSLAEWPAGEHLPIAACRCHRHVEVSVHQARKWLESRRDKFVYEP